MISLKAKNRTELGRKSNKLRNAGIIPAIVYGHKVKPVTIEVDAKEFEKILRQAGESSLVELTIEGDKEKRPVLIHDLQKNHVTDEITHVDFFQASLTEEIEVKVPLVFEGTSLAVKDLGGTLVRNISELSVKALAAKLPHEIVVSIDGLNTFEDHILAKDIKLPEGVKLHHVKPEEIVASVAQVQNVEEDLAKEVVEDVENVEKVEKEKKEEVVDETPEAK
jgi:large subunit ribosomal protein L25